MAKICHVILFWRPGSAGNAVAGLGQQQLQNFQFSRDKGTHLIAMLTHKGAAALQGFHADVSILLTVGAGHWNEYTV